MVGLRTAEDSRSLMDSSGTSASASGRSVQLRSFVSIGNQNRNLERQFFSVHFLGRTDNELICNNWSGALLLKNVVVGKATVFVC